MADWKEHLVGFDARVSSPDWTPERRSTYLLRENVEQPFSCDPRVWPSLFDKGAYPRPSWVGAFQDLWSDLDRLREHLADAAAGATYHLVAFSILAHGDDDPLGPALNDRCYEPHSPRWLPLPSAQPEIRSPDWALLGYDLADKWGTSGLSNCGYRPAEVEALRRNWAEHLSEQHLFLDLEEADRFRRVCDSRVTEHAPFFVYGIWSVEAVQRTA
ncbi:MAG TPA: hypothetical protein VGK67_28715 [Myxococcales bacterium]|jgi:hypothetical protein